MSRRHSHETLIDPAESVSSRPGLLRPALDNRCPDQFRSRRPEFSAAYRHKDAATLDLRRNPRQGAPRLDTSLRRSPQSSPDREFSLAFPAGPPDFLRSLMGGEDPDRALTERPAYRSRTIAIRSLELLLSPWLSTQAKDVCRRFGPSP